MIHLQIIGKDGTKLQPLFRTAIQEGTIKSFSVSQVKGGLIVEHKTYKGSIEFNQNRHILLATIKCKNNAREWQLLESLIGRIAYHFRDQISNINLQFD